LPDQLVDYIKKQLQAGYSEQQVKDYLIKYGYDQSAVSTAFSQLSTAKPAKNTLVPYIKQYLGQGYTADGIRNFLIQKGYDQKQVDIAIQQVTHPEIKHKHTIDVSPKVIATVMVIFLGLGLIGASLYYFLAMDSGFSDELLDYSISLQQTSIEPGGVLYFTNQFTNFGQDRRYDISVEFSLSNRDTGEIFDEWKELFAIDTVLTKQMSVPIPSSTEPGNYMVKGIVSYGDFEEDAYRTFKIIELGPDESCFDGIKNQDEASVDCGGVCSACETCFDNTMNQDETDVDCGGICGTCTVDTTTDTDDDSTDTDSDSTSGYVDTSIYEEYDQNYIVDLTNSNPETAKAYCLDFSTTENKDKCIKQVAKTSDSYEYCHDIISDLTKDDCYMSFAYENNFDACDYISNPFVKQSCNQLKDIYDIQQMASTGDYSGVGEVVGMSITGPDGEEIV
jgi:hypothetical protein